MLNAIRDFFDRNIKGGQASEPADSRRNLQLATAALLFEMMRMDREITEAERDRAVQAVRGRFDLDEAATAELLRLAEEEALNATDYFQFTSLINEGLEPSQKVEIVELMWEVAYADGDLHRYEEHLVRKIADLIYVPHGAFIAAKHRARQKVLGN